MIKCSRFVKKKQEDGSVLIQCKIKKGKPTGKEIRAICDALNEAVAQVLAPPVET
jgi:hypothetical protein